MANSVIEPAVVMRPILLALDSVNHNTPSGPAAMPFAPLAAVGIGYSVMLCALALTDQPKRHITAGASPCASVNPPLRPFAIHPSLLNWYPILLANALKLTDPRRAPLIA